jgi:hypothetical protein
VKGSSEERVLTAKSPVPSYCPRVWQETDGKQKEERNIFRFGTLSKDATPNQNNLDYKAVDHSVSRGEC